MASQLLTVRLSPEDEAAAQRLQDNGVNLSDLVRRTIHEEAARLRPKRFDPEAIKAELLRQHPELDPNSREGAAMVRTPRPDTTDRRAMQAFIRERIRRRNKR